MTTLTPRDIENFWIRVYFHGNPNLEIASIKRAYRDFSRTLHGIGKEIYEDEVRYSGLEETMMKILKTLRTKMFQSQIVFDRWHRKSCEMLQNAFFKSTLCLICRSSTEVDQHDAKISVCLG